MTDSNVVSGSNRNELDRALAHGLAWSAVGRWLSQIFRWVATIMTARVLLPADYGIAGIALLFVGLLQQFAEFGFGAAIVQQRHLAPSVVRQIGGAAIVISLVLALLMIATAPLVARYYGEPALSLLVSIMSLKLLIDAFAVVPRSVLARDLQFKSLTILESVESVLMAALTVGIAWLTRSYWAFVVGNLVSGAVFTIGATMAARTGPSWPRSYSAIRPQVVFGVNVVISRVAWYGYTNADFAIVGRVMSTTVLGLYTFAWNIASVPAEKLSGLVLRVAPSILAAVRTDPAEMRRYYLLLVRGVALVTFPVAVGLALVAGDLVQALFGDKWAGAVGALELLAAFFGIRCIATLAPVVMIASGEPRVDRNYSLVFLFILPPLFLLGSRWGIEGVAATWLIAYPVLFSLFGQHWVLQKLNISVPGFLAELWPAVASCGLMALTVWFAHDLVSNAWPDWVKLCVFSAIGAFTYLLALRILFRSVADSALSLIRNRGRLPT